MFKAKKGQKYTEEVRMAMLAEPITDDPNAKRLGKHNADKILRKARARDRVSAFERGDNVDVERRKDSDTTKAVAAIPATQARDTARKYYDLAIRTLVEVMQYAKKAKDRTYAAEALLDRGFGKPVQGIEHSGPDGSAIPIQHLIDRPPNETYAQWVERVNSQIKGLKNEQNEVLLEIKSDEGGSAMEVLTPEPLEIPEKT